MSNMARVSAAFSELLNMWTCGGNASLQLETKNGECTVSFTAHLGHPGALLLPTPLPPSSPSFQSHLPTPSGQRNRGPASPCFPTSQMSPTSSGQRHRGTGDKMRSRVRAASHQAAESAAATAQAVPAPSTSPLKTAETEILAANAAQAVTVVKAETVTVATAMAANEICKETEEGDMASTSCKPMLPPAADVKCWNCDILMTPEHQCEEPTPVPSSALVPPVHCSLESAPPSGAVSDPSQTLTLSPPGKPPAPRSGLNITKLCHKCEERHPVWSKCQR